MEKTFFLKPGRDKSARMRHPWIFSGAVDHISGKPFPGEVLPVKSSTGESLGWAAYSPFSQIRARFLTFDPGERIGPDFYRHKLQTALQTRRQFIGTTETNAMRLIHAEADGLPGLIVDRYADWLVVQFLTAGMDIQRDLMVDLLVEQTGVKNVYERSDADVRRLEGLDLRAEPIRGAPPPEYVEIEEFGLRFRVDLIKGQKTGFYLDQRRNRRRVAELVRGMRLLNCFCYTGGFTVHALASGATEVLSIDSSAEALHTGKKNVEINHLPSDASLWLEGDVFKELRNLRDRAQVFDAIILDPPKFAPTFSQVEQAARGYKDINLLAIKLLRPGGLLFTFSCSGGISPDLFQKIVAGSARDAGADLQILEQLGPGPDHPVAVNFPESAYLKGLVCQKVAG